ncbi:MAG: hypothetical protein QOG99_3800, partial [Frankiales bacterium]|nr:hypothetical protein [Frankiales bacterium]
ALPLRTLEEAVATWADELAQFPER